MKGKWSAGKITAVICGSAAAAIVLFIALYIDIFQLVRKILIINARNESYQQAYDDDSQYDEYDDNDAEEDSYEKEDGTDDVYYEFHDEIRDDLSYQVEFETYEEVLEENENISLNIIYPVLHSAEEEDLTGVNNVVQKELEEILEYVHSVSDWISDGEEYIFEAESYVTYMDEEVLSIVYVEHGYLNDESYESYVISANIDMESKIAFTNSQLLAIDDEFSIEFRKRCEKQNGEIESLYYYSDQDITQMLTSDDTLIIFYTPLGMEVGFNYYYGWVTVTYPDYQKYQRKF